MTDARFNAIYELVQKKQLEEIKKEYESLNKDINVFNTFEDFLDKTYNVVDKENNNKNHQSNDELKIKCISSEIVERDNLKFKIYLINFPFYTSADLDENYNSVPLQKKELYESGLILSKDNYVINKILCSVSDDVKSIEEEYQSLLSKIKNNEIENILDDIEKYVKNY